MSGPPFTRSVAVFTEIGAITADDAGRRVRVIGYVVDHQEPSFFILSDDTGRIAITFEQPPNLEAFIRVLGSVAISSDGQPMIRAEIIQDLKGIDIKLFKHAMKLFSVKASGRKA